MIKKKIISQLNKEERFDFLFELNNKNYYYDDRYRRFCYKNKSKYNHKYYYLTTKEFKNIIKGFIEIFNK